MTPDEREKQARALTRLAEVCGELSPESIWMLTECAISMRDREVTIRVRAELEQTLDLRRMH
jgi:hypothetical protein